MDPEEQGKRTGSRFMGMIENDIKKNGFAGIFLQTDEDKPSYRFYVENNFKNLPIHVSLYKSVES